MIDIYLDVARLSSRIVEACQTKIRESDKRESFAIHIQEYAMKITALVEKEYKKVGEINTVKPDCKKIYTGDRVRYVPDYGPVEYGKVKKVNEDETAFVVYNCNNEWDNIGNYTAANTNLSDLILGWD